MFIHTAVYVYIYICIFVDILCYWILCVNGMKPIQTNESVCFGNCNCQLPC